MTTKRFPIYRDFINLILLYMLCISFMMVLASSLHMNILPMEYLGVVVVLLGSYVLREKIKMLLVTLILHLVLIGVCILFPMIDAPGKTRLVIMAIVVSILDLHNWVNKEKSVPDIHPGLGAILFGAILLTSGKFEIGYSAVIYYMGVGFVVLIMVRFLIINFYELSLTGQLTSEMPVREIFRNNSIAVMGITLLAAIAMLFVKADKLILALNRFGYYVWEKISAFLERVLSNKMDEETTRFPPLADYGRLLQELANEEPDNSLFTLLMRLFESLLILLCIVVVIYCVSKALLFLWRALFGKRTISAKKYKSFTVKNEVRQSLRQEAASERRSSLFKTPAEKIRHLYKKELRKYKKSGADIRNTKTPCENSNVVLAAVGANLGEATQLYESVRYNDPDLATAADVSKLKSCFKSAGK